MAQTAPEKPKPAGFGLPDVGTLIAFPPGTALKAGCVGMVMKTKQLAKGRKLTVVIGSDAFSSELETKVITELPADWIVVPHSKAYDALKGLG